MKFLIVAIFSLMLTTNAADLDRRKRGIYEEPHHHHVAVHHDEPHHEQVRIVKVPYPVVKHVHVPVERTVVKKVIEHVPVPQPYPVEKIIKKVVHVPVIKEVVKHVPVPVHYERPKQYALIIKEEEPGWVEPQHQVWAAPHSNGWI